MAHHHTFRCSLRRTSQILRVVGDLPAPVLTAHTAITGFFALSMV